jgi:outer membrane receptor protein involved in Fe transport
MTHRRVGPGSLISSCLLAGIVLLAAAAFATIFGAVQGIVHDPNHRPIAGAQVTIKDVNSQWSQSATTDANGEYRFQAVPVGRYTVSASAPGFEPQSRDVTVNSNTSPSVHFGLAVGAVQQSVEVKGTPELINPSSTTTQTLVDRAQIAETPGASRTNSMAMITDFVPGAYVVHDQLHVRGGHQASWLMDGVPIPNTNIASNLGPQIDPKDIDYLEVQRGGLSAEQGERTYAAFNVAPRSGFDRTRQAEVIASYGSFNSTNSQVNFGSHTQRLGYYGSISGNRSELGLETPTSQVIHDLASGLSAFGSLIYNADPSNQLRLVVSARGDHYQVPNDPDAQAAGVRDVNDERDAFALLSWVHTWKDGVLLTISPFYHFNRANYLGGAQDFPISPTDVRDSHYAGGHVTLGILRGHHNVRLGLDGFVETEGETFRVIFNDQSAANVAQQQTTRGGVIAGFLEDQYKPWQWLAINAGLRLTSYRGLIIENIADPRLGAAITIPRLHWVLRGFWGRYYQPPPLTTLGGSLLDFASAQDIGFLPLRGERDTQVEVGLGIPVRGWTFDFSAFRTRARNFFDHDVLGNSNIFFPLTIDHARIRGLEASVRSPRIAQRAELYLTYSHQWTQARGGVTGGLADLSALPENDWFYLDHDQRDTLALGTRLVLPWRAWSTVNVNYGSGFLDGDGPGHLPAHTTADVSLGRNFGESWALQFNATNIFNRRYLLDNSNTFGGTHWVDPRVIAGEVRFRFHY